jgi:sugar lactone lactonase YvrE
MSRLFVKQLAVSAVLATAAIAAPSGAAPSGAAQSAKYSCLPGDGLNFVCGLTASEDIARIPDSPWLVVSGLNVGAPANLYLLDHRTKRAVTLFPTAGKTMKVDPALRSGCSKPPNLAKISTDGISLHAGPNQQHLLYAANHGDRHAIEIFRIDARGIMPKATWVGCITMPPHTLANAVVALKDGGLIVSSFYDPQDAAAWERMDRGENTGSLWEWHAGRGFSRLAHEISGANGLAISQDESTLYVSAWSDRQLLIINRSNGSRREVPLDFLPDNIKVEPDGTLLIAGQSGKVADIAACGPECSQDWIIARVDPVRAVVTPLLTRKGNAQINYACGALRVDDTLYITARGDHRLAYLSVASLPVRATADR